MWDRITSTKLIHACILSSGGMQDYNYVHSNCFEITLELGCVKYPQAVELPKFWDANKYPMLVFMGQVRHSYTRRKGNISLTVESFIFLGITVLGFMSKRCFLGHLKF